MEVPKPPPLDVERAGWSGEICGYSQLVPRNKELLELSNSLKLSDGSWQQRISESGCHDLEAVDDLVFR